MALISESVGNAAWNLPDDVKIVKQMVFMIATSSGVGPTEQERKKINPDSTLCEPELIRALARFQQKVVPTEAPSGGRVLPTGKTIQRLLEYAAIGDTRSEAAKSNIIAKSKLSSQAMNIQPEILQIRDVRLEGYKPEGDDDKILEVTCDTPLEWPINWVLGKFDELGYLRVKIHAHGYPVQTDTTTSIDWKKFALKKDAVWSQGGAGVLFCKEHITLDTLKFFAPWKGKVAAIDMYACGAAYITRGFEGKVGDGNLLCYKLAQISGAKVTASTATQWYYKGHEQDPHLRQVANWSGAVYTWSPTGKVSNVEHDTLKK